MRQQNICPCCGHALNAKAARQIVAEIQFGPVARRIIEVLADHFGMWISRERIAALAYADYPDGGPEYAENIVSTRVSEYLPRLQKRGLTIERVRSGHAGMRMTWAKR